MGIEYSVEIIGVEMGCLGRSGGVYRMAREHVKGADGQAGDSTTPKKMASRYSTEGSKSSSNITLME